MGQWHNDVVRTEILRHVGLVSPKRVGVIATRAARSTYAEVFAGLSDKIHILSLEAIDFQHIGVIAVVAEDNAAARAAYADVMTAIGNEVPVVYCLPDRRIPTAAPGWEHTGILADGMFKLASIYAQTVAQPKADYIEFGVYDGRSFILACQTLKGVCSAFHAFDSFAGIMGAQSTEQTHFKDKQYSASVETLEYNLRFAGVDRQTVRIVPGFFQDTIKGRKPADFGIERVSVVHIDTDVYEPSLLALEFVAPALVQGSLLLLDDYDHLAASDAKGERRAVHEWLRNHPEFDLEPYRNYAIFSRAFIVHRRAYGDGVTTARRGALDHP